MKTVLITGGAGFIGSNLSEYLLKKGHRVIALDNLFSSSKENIAHLLNDNNFSFIEKDITEKLSFKEEIDEIYNLACPASPLWYQKDPLATVKANVLGMINVLELAREKKARILQASTSEVYGDPLEHPQRESYRGNVNMLGPRACYDEGKRCAETLCVDYDRQYGLDVKIVRIFNTYGPRMADHDGRVISNFITQAIADLPVTIYGDGSQTRSFQYIDDLILGMVAMMKRNNFSGPVNLGNPEEYTVKYLAEKIILFTGSRSEIKHMALPEDDPLRRRPDISLAEKELGWKPSVVLDDGLQKTISYFRKRSTL